LSEILQLETKFVNAFSPLVSALKIITERINKTIQTLTGGKGIHQWPGEFIVGE
jgi:hypothetical protein